MENHPHRQGLSRLFDSIREQREQAQLSIRALAEKLYMSPSQYHALENGEVRMDLERYFQLAEALEFDGLEKLKECFTPPRNKQIKYCFSLFFTIK
jgi:transcriptional regulator with XRE-family HTH domain